MFSRFVSGAGVEAMRFRGGTARLLAATLGLVGLALVATFAAARASGEPLWNLTRDPASVNDARALIGILSNAGIVLWGACAAVCLFASRLVATPRQRSYLRAAAALTVVLMLDDALLLHERAFPRLLHVPEPVVICGYLLATGAWLLGFAREILATRWVVLATAFAAFAGSLVADNVLAFTSAATFVEDALKFAGIALWLAYFADTGLTLARAAR